MRSHDRLIAAQIRLTRFEFYTQYLYGIRRIDPYLAELGYSIPIQSRWDR